MNQPLPSPPPEWVRVGDTTISEADIAREMQHHRADDPRRAREEAARALVVHELLRLEVERPYESCHRGHDGPASRDTSVAKAYGLSGSGGEAA
jgi:hypothetical protein